MSDLVRTLSDTPLPTILVLAGILFWLLAIAGSLAGKITVERGKQTTAGLVGTALIVLGSIRRPAGTVKVAFTEAFGHTPV